MVGQAEVVTDLVNHRALNLADDPLFSMGEAENLRTIEDNPIGEGAEVSRGGSVRVGAPPIDAAEKIARSKTQFGPLRIGRLLLDHDRDILQTICKLGRETLDRPGDEPLEFLRRQ